jgi:hypothetical protein
MRRWRRRQACLLLPRREERRADDALGHLLHAEHEHGVVLAGRDGARGHHDRRSAARAAGLDVDDRASGRPECVEDAVAGGHARVGSAAEGGLETMAVDTGVGQRGSHGSHAHLGNGLALEPAERMQADTCHFDGGHRRSLTRTPT